MPNPARPAEPPSDRGAASAADKRADAAEVALSAVTPLPPPLPMAADAAPAAQTEAKPPAAAAPVDGSAAAPRVSSPRSATPRPPPLAAFVVELPPAGDLSIFDAPRVIGWAVATGLSGCLWLAPSSPFAPPLHALSDDNTPHRELYLENGGLIGAMSTVAGDGLVDYLLPLWSRQQAQRARSIVASVPQQKPREQLQALVQDGLVPRGVAVSHLAGYVNTLCTRALTPSPGRYRVLPRALTGSERIEPPLPLRRLLVEGLRKGASLEFLQMRLGPAATCMRPTAVIGATEGGAALLDVGLSGAEEVALACYNGRYSLADIVQRARIGEHAAYVLAYALLCLGAAAVPRVTARNLQKPRPAALSPSAQTPDLNEKARQEEAAGQSGQQRAVNDIEASIRRVQQKFRQVEDGDYFALLELSPPSSIAEVLRAHETLRAEFLPAALPYRCRSSMDRELRQIARVLDEARLILGSEAARRGYLERLTAIAR